MDPKIIPFLKLQEIDTQRLRLHSQIDLLPKDIELFNSKIQNLRSEDQKLKAEVQSLELKRKELDNELKTAEEKINKFKYRQTEVKKNEEYQALTSEITREEVNVKVLEDQELHVLMLIDEKKKQVDEQSKILHEEIESYKERIQLTEKNLLEVKSLFEKQTEIFNAAISTVDGIYYKKYQQVAKQVKKPPFVVELNEGRCMGCHLKVSQEVVSKVRHKDSLQQCDSCSRILYWPS